VEQLAATSFHLIIMSSDFLGFRNIHGEGMT
jgi:hypothetical protein